MSTSGSYIELVISWGSFITENKEKEVGVPLFGVYLTYTFNMMI